MNKNGGRKVDENKTAVVTLIIYALIMAGVIYYYQDFAITLAAFVVLAVLIFQYVVPRIREKKKPAD
jgi:amino acid permease